METRIETAEKVAEIMNDVDSSCKARAWAKGEHVRVYATKGYAIIDEPGKVNIDGLGGFCFKAALYCDEHGIETYRA